MADSKGGVFGSFPWASLAVLMAFVASTQLVPHAFDALRPAEKARAQAPLDPDLEINARLWEDPFSALRRYELERSERCERQRKAGQAPDGDCGKDMPKLRDPHGLLARLDADHNQRIDDTLVILALMPGADFVGAEEARRRIRYATLAGLLAQDYVPDNAERLSLLEFKLIDGGADAASGGYMVPYELLSLRRPVADDPPSRYAQIALLWVDETALPLRKLDAVARLTEQLMGRQARERAQLRFKLGDGEALPRLAVIGPSSTDALRTALRDLRCAAELNNTAGIRVSSLAHGDAVRCARRGEDVTAGLPPDVLAGYRLLAQAEFYNPSSTAPERMLPELERYTRTVTGLGDSLDAFLTQHFSRLTGAPPASAPVHMVRTVGSDADLIDNLVTELRLRLPRKHRRVVVVAERDSIYAQALVEQLRDCLPPGLKDTLQVIYFFRGIDGATTKEASAAAALATAAAKAPPLEWPESRDQLDYLRRLGTQLKLSESARDELPIGAIGIFANDVHDKLLVLQALHENFPDRMFFTTDMDARYLHPRTQAFTRNLVVASSLPLAFYPVPPGQASSAVDLQAGTPPLRDIYQTSTYAAARRAGCRSALCKQREAEALDSVLKNTSVYEIGRSNMVPLAGYALEKRPPQTSAGRIFVALLLATVFGGMLFAWPSTPSMRQARRVLLPPGGSARRLTMEPTAMVLVTLHAVLLSYGMASLIEFVLPGRLNFSHARLLAALAGCGALLVGLTAWKAGERRRLAGLLAAALLALAATWVALAWPSGGWLPGGVCRTCEPTVWLEGVSAWPSHLIHLLALFMLLWTLDWAWADTQEELRGDSDWLHLPRPPKHPSLRQLLRHWFETASVMFWKPGVGYSCDFRQLWIEYGERGEATPRTVRTLFWYGLTLFVVGLLFFGLNDGQIPEVPVRGREHRSLVSVTLYAAMLLLPLLIVAVADATVLLTRFVRHLNVGRSFYPDETIEVFARGLGAEQKALWAQRLNARPEARGEEGGFRMHTLLDDWIDVQVVARRSAPVARLVIGPFVVLALLVVARSRLFDNWSLTPAIAVGVSFYVAVLIGLTFLLKQAAENTRRRALESMQADLRWLAGSGKPLADLVEPFKRLIAQVENEQHGAFAPFFDQPLLKAILVPLGGAGGSQLFDYLLLGR
ncbi:hypothetical protein LXT12_21995 [Pelomonas sp. P7]|uniref:Uncharacterized protein n=1 Tax=Pelomonas caseinilytica TaxID=2906763 RepID=A0ABS8XGB2_9BURK|nr:hypothetical protein [Pelomonas sp. P7]MCE4539927.1 hypothetical protein [Pelomonas sp. P7]